MAASDQMVWQGELAVEQAIGDYQGQSVSDNVQHHDLVLTPKNAEPRTYPPLAVTGGISSGLFLSAHISG